MTILRKLLLALLLIASPMPALADEAAQELENAAMSQADGALRVLRGQQPAEEVFAESFLKVVSPAKLQEVAASLIEQGGAMKMVDEFEHTGPGAGTFLIWFERQIATATIQVEAAAPHRITGFAITQMRPFDDTPFKVLEELGKLPGSTTIGVWMLGDDELKPVLTNKDYQPLALGSTFKLYVLSALAQEVKAGRRKWDDVVPLDAHSLPSGQLQDWPIGAPLTLHSLASLMISQSDNTATDVLMRLLGREAIAAELRASGHENPAATLPMLTTVEAFALKTGDPARITAYQAADEAARKALLDGWADSLKAEEVDASRFSGSTPMAIDTLEWFASAQDLAALLRRIRDGGDKQAMAIMAINPALAPGAAETWAYVGYKGGSEPGVLNLTWLLQDKEGRWFVVVLGWNNPEGAADQAKLLPLAHRMIGMLAQ